jgi:ribose transport system substrate-binding protein
MSWLKRGLAITGTAALSLGLLTGCSSATSGSGAKSKDVYMIVSTLNNPFFVSVKDGAEYEAKKLGYNLVVQNANNDNQTELNMAQTDIQKKPAVIILDPVDSNAIVSAIDSANKNNVPVLAFDRKPVGGDIKSFIGFDAILAGKQAADTLGNDLNGTGKIAEIQGIMGTNVAQDRSKGFEDEMKAKFPNIQIVATQPADFDRSKALDVMTNILQAHPDINGVYAANDEMAMGALAALKTALKTANLTDKVKLVGNDGIADSLQAINDGTMAATNAESPYYEGMKVAEIAGNIIDGKSVQKETTLKGRVVNKDSIADYNNYLKSVGVPDSAITKLK